MECVHQLAEGQGVMPKLENLGKYKGDIVAEALANNLTIQIQYNPGLIRRMLREEKTMEHCMDFVMSKARALAKEESKKTGNRSIGINIDDTTVYQWATQYFFADGLDEDKDKDFRKPYKPPVKTSAPPEPPKPTDTQMSLFDSAAVEEPKQEAV